jgi:hypothetical protein
VDKLKITTIMNIIVIIVARVTIAVVKLTKNNNDDNTTTNKNYFPITVIDCLDRDLTIRSPNKIVSVLAASTSHP